MPQRYIVFLMRLIQVSESIVEPQTRKREITALTEAMVELNINNGTIITPSESEKIKHNGEQLKYCQSGVFFYPDELSASLDNP